MSRRKTGKFTALFLGLLLVLTSFPVGIAFAEEGDVAINEDGVTAISGNEGEAFVEELIDEGTLSEEDEIVLDEDRDRGITENVETAIVEDNEVISAAGGDVAIDETNFPDAEFRLYVKNNFDIIDDDVLSQAERKIVTKISLPDFCYRDLKGIEHFPALEELDCSWNYLTSLDVSQNTALKELRCRYNNLTSLNISRCTVLKELHCDFNNLTSLDLSQNKKLYFLNCNYNRLTNLDVSKNEELRILLCSGNELTSLDLGNGSYYMNVHLDNNTYNIEVDQIGLEFDLNSLPGNFDSSRSSDWDGGKVRGSTLILDSSMPERVVYNYNCRFDIPMKVTLNVAYTIDTSKPQGIYTNQRANVRSAKTGEVIGTYNKGQYIYATPGKDGYYYFKYNGQDAKIYQSVITTNTGSYLLINNTVNVRDPFNKIVDVKYPGERIYGVRIGDYYRFYDNGVKFIWHSFAAATPQKGTAYVVDGVNVRSEGGALLGSLARGSAVTGVQKADGYLYFNYKGQPAKVWADLLEYAMPQGLYFKGQTNIRNQALDKVVDVKYKGERINAVDLGPKSNYYRFVENGQVRLVHKSLLTSQAQTGTAYVVEPTNIRSESGKLIGNAKRGSAITGVQKADGYVHFTYQNKAAKIWTGGLEYAVPKTRTVKFTSNVRDSDLNIIGTKAKGAKIYAVDLGAKSSYYRFYENGTVKLIHESCVQ